MAEDFLVNLPDGTVKQRNPFTGTEVWTAPGRGDRPLGVTHPDPHPLAARDFTHTCAFCQARYLDTPPEKQRLVRDGDAWRLLDALPADALFDTVADFRRVPNLFEILGYDYWHLNYGYVLPAPVRRRRDAYLASVAGRAHVLAVESGKLRASGVDVAALGEDDILARASGFFGGGHDVVIARRHYVDGATDSTGLASSGTLTPEEHAQFIAFSADAARSKYDLIPAARYVVVFQNWLKPAGASFDHLHKQIVAVDDVGAQQEAAIQRATANPNVFNDDAVAVAQRNALVIAHNEHAVAFAGFGHRYPTIEVYSRSPEGVPWLQSPEEVRGMSDLLHAMHAATGADVASNEEWHYRPPGTTVAMPWRIMLKWRVSTLAGFEGATKIYLNTIAPGTLRARVVARLVELREQGRIAAGLRLADEADLRPDPLLYR
ncbi:DUF4921 domain-containing protein [Tessaracoccus aquimaris]|uniref:DUF4921 domain-containing protein n=1 Tax=Tessaracoccus aquimaris TaxID=1332264 RepID=A0A1Q2CMR9_9ACTN|nr:DUF4921 family protein [Tessaracoccus aquimaris]AQP47360.1 DUF4921 domain-containing protein [Tessaracoccus aquimaris]